MSPLKYFDCTKVFYSHIFYFTLFFSLDRGVNVHIKEQKTDFTKQFGLKFNSKT